MLPFRVISTFAFSAAVALSAPASVLAESDPGSAARGSGPPIELGQAARVDSPPAELGPAARVDSLPAELGPAARVDRFSAELGPAARVNGVPVERGAVQQLVKGLARAEPSPPDSQRIETLNRAALESLIDLELLYQEAVRRKIELPRGDVDRQVAKVRQHFDSDEHFAEALANRGLTPESLRLDTIRTGMADQLLQRTVWRDLSVSSDEVTRFYQANRGELARPLDDLHDSIARMLLDEKKSESRARLVDELRQKASIQRLQPYGSELPKRPVGKDSDPENPEKEGWGRQDR